MRSGGTGRPRSTLARNGRTSSIALGPPNAISRTASYPGSIAAPKLGSVLFVMDYNGFNGLHGFSETRARAKTRSEIAFHPAPAPLGKHEILARRDDFRK